MAFAEPQTVTVATVAKTLPRVGVPVGNFQGQFQMDDEAYRLDIGQSKAKRARHVVQLTARKIAADPLATSTNVEYLTKVTLTVDAPLTGFTTAEKKDLVVALADWLKASTNANTVKLVGYEA